MQLSIVTTLYKSERFVKKFITKAIATAETHGGDFEIVLVDDGCPDNSSTIAKQIAATDPRIVVVELSRNFGHHAAALCAIEIAKGELVFLIDSDLEVDPIRLADFVSTMNAEGADVVYGVQETRQGRFVDRHLGGAFWKIFNLMSDVKVPNDIMTERLMTRRYVDSLLQLGDRNLFMGGMFYWPGFTQVPIALMKEPRKGTTYSFGKRARLLVQALSSFSSLPLIVIFWAGICVFGLTCLYALNLILQKIIVPETIVSGFTFVAVLSLLSFGINLMALGVIGLYVHRIFRQVQQRPRYIVKNVTGRK